MSSVPGTAQLPTVDREGYIHGSGASPLCRRKPITLGSKTASPNNDGCTRAPPPSPVANIASLIAADEQRRPDFLNASNQGRGQMRRKSKPPPIQSTLQPPPADRAPRTSDATLKDIIAAYADSRRSVSIRSTSVRSPSSTLPSQLPSPVLSDTCPPNASAIDGGTFRNFSDSIWSQRSLLDIDEDDIIEDPPKKRNISGSLSKGTFLIDIDELSIQDEPPPPPPKPSRLTPLRNIKSTSPSQDYSTPTPKPRGHRRKGQSAGNFPYTTPPQRVSPIPRKAAHISKIRGPLTLFPPTAPQTPAHNHGDCCVPVSQRTVRLPDTPTTLAHSIATADTPSSTARSSPGGRRSSEVLHQGYQLHSVFEDDDEKTSLVGWFRRRRRTNTDMSLEKDKEKPRNRTKGNIFGCCFGEKDRSYIDE